MERSSGALTVRRSLSALLGRRLVLTVRAADRGNPPRQSSTRLTLSVVNGHVPVFKTSVYEWRVSEATRLATNVGRVEAEYDRGVRYRVAGKVGRFSFLS